MELILDLLRRLPDYPRQRRRNTPYEALTVS